MNNVYLNSLLGLFLAICFSFLICSKNNPTKPKTPAYGVPITDIDGNIYKTVVIGNQVWMAENLKTTKLNDGTLLKNMVNPNLPEYCFYYADSIYYNDTIFCTNYSDSASFIDSMIFNDYGLLYNGFAIKTGKLAPQGWHIPTDSEWTVLINFLGGAIEAGNKIREPGTVHWENYVWSTTNETGFTALPGGYISDIDLFPRQLGFTGCWWTSTTDSVFNNNFNNIKDWYISSNYAQIISDDSSLRSYNSIRCIKD